MDDATEPAQHASRPEKDQVVRASPVEVLDLLLFRHRLNLESEMPADPTQLTVKLVNGPELRRLVEVLADALAVANDAKGSEQAKERLRHQLGDFTWLKRMIVVD